ncbi:D(2) dopamine receptor-like [Strongylocentrotus purpuratus]|uniref:G-protein coupled receptors family 1 profile domain-containing protein n=1 Tax=Strongylocentrotus purpuratus TaxID=7668 RepID=A0A7M7SUW5_STRPU|nr:D(2) dopamine receptor-like [Strongylocentrotus purpuratus]
MTAPRATVYLVCTWVLSIICACLPMSSVASYAYIEDIGACTVDWERSTLGYTIAAHLVSFCLPLAMILFCYAKIYIVARKVKRQIRPLPAHFAEHPSRWVNEKSGCERRSEGASKATVNERTPKEKMKSLPEHMTSVDTRLSSKIEELIKSPKSEGHFNIRALRRENRKRSMSLQEVGNDHLFSRHGLSSEDTDDRRVNFSIQRGLSTVPNLFQVDPNVPVTKADSNTKTANIRAHKILTLNGKQNRNKRLMNRHKSSTSGESGEWKPLASRYVSRKAVRLKKIQSLRDTKAATTLLILLGVFLVCWMPYVVVTFLLNAHMVVRPIVHSALFMIALTNSVLNVFVYGVLNTKFRVGFRKLWKPCCLWLNGRCKSKSEASAIRLRSVSQSLRNNGPMTDRADGIERREYFSEHVR